MGFSPRAGATLTATALAGLIGAACEPAQPMSIGLTVDRQAWTIDDAGEFEERFVLTGTVSCTRPEPIDLFVGGVPAAEDGHIPCSGPGPQRWREGFITSEPIDEGTYRISVEGCTNPGEPIDEDCVTVERAVDVKAK